MDIINVMWVRILTWRHTFTSSLYPKGTLYHIYHPRIMSNGWSDCIAHEVQAWQWEEKQLWSQRVKNSKVAKIDKMNGPVLSLLTRCGCKPSHFHLSITFSSSQIHHHTACLHNSLCDTHEPLWLLIHNTCPCWSHYQLHHQRGFMYKMCMWPMDPAVTFPFLDGSPCCFWWYFPCFPFFFFIQFYCVGGLHPMVHIYINLSNSSWGGPFGYN